MHKPEPQEPDFHEKKLLPAAVAGMTTVALALLFLVILGIRSCHAGEVPKTRAVNAIIGESEGEGLFGMKLVAHSIRNRGHLRRVYGEHARRVKEHIYGAKIFVQAVRAWDESAHEEDPTGGANSWYSKEDMKKDPGIVSRCEVRKTYRNQIFMYCEGA